MVENAVNCYKFFLHLDKILLFKHFLRFTTYKTLL